MARNPSTRKTFVQSAVSFSRKYGFNGVDVDWELPNGAADKANHVALIRELKQAGGASFLVTAAVSAGLWALPTAYDIPQLAKYIDFVNVMTYDFHGDWENFTGMNAPLYSVKGDTLNTATGLAYWANHGMPKRKIILGVPTYGIGWTLQAKRANQGVNAKAVGVSAALPYTQTKGDGAYYEFCELIASKKYRRHFDNVRKVPYLENGSQWFSYEDVQSVTAKMNFVKQQGYGGAFVWTLDEDDFNGKCSNGKGVRYPLVGTIARILGGKNIR
ncbi:CHT-1 protein [Aphelenchoides avenae]|nr:CHT-1 protein [Aphelenchus avenae]